MLQTLLFGLYALLWLAIGASAVSWGVLLFRQFGKPRRAILESVVPLRDQARPFWTPFELLVLLGAFLAVSSLVTAWMISIGWVELPQGDKPSAPPRSMTGQLAPVLATSIAGIAATMLLVAWLHLFDGHAIGKLGLRPRVADFWLGLKGSLMILPPVMLIAAAVSRIVPYQHDVLKTLAQITEPIVFLATMACTALVVPLFEEFAFRVVLQGGLQGWADRSAQDWADRSAGAADEPWRPRAYWPILVSSLVFALMHSVGQGAAPIPLFVMALGLGYLYRQTGSIFPSLVVHCVLNGLTLSVEMLKLQVA